MEIQKDFKELLKLFSEANIEYMVVGAYALAFHGVPRNTGDIDIWVSISKENASKIITVLQEFGFGSLGLTEGDFLQTDQVVQLGYPPVRIDLMTHIDGVEFKNAYKNCDIVEIDDFNIQVISKVDLISNKRATGRYKDLGDIESLGEKP